MENKTRAILTRILWVLSMAPYFTGCASRPSAADARRPITIEQEPELRAVIFKAGRPEKHDQLEDSVVSWNVSWQSLAQNAETIAGTPPEVKFRIVGLVDGVECQGDDCTALALRRAHLVAAWLRSHGVESERISLGASSPSIMTSKNLDEAQRESMRRVIVEPTF